MALGVDIIFRHSHSECRSADHGCPWVLFFARLTTGLAGIGVSKLLAAWCGWFHSKIFGENRWASKFWPHTYPKNSDTAMVVHQILISYWYLPTQYWRPQTKTWFVPESIHFGRPPRNASSGRMPGQWRYLTGCAPLWDMAMNIYFALLVGNDGNEHPFQIHWTSIHQLVFTKQPQIHMKETWSWGGRKSTTPQNDNEVLRRLGGTTSTRQFRIFRANWILNPVIFGSSRNFVGSIGGLFLVSQNRKLTSQCFELCRFAFVWRVCVGMWGGLELDMSRRACRSDFI